MAGTAICSYVPIEVFFCQCSASRDGMCNRFNLRASPAEVQEFFDLFRVPQFESRYNIAPSQQVMAIRQDHEQKRVADFFSWGLLPPDATPRIRAKPPTIARAEGVATTRAFRNAFRQRRCVVPVSGYYEWPETSDEYKEPWHVFRPGGELLAFAGLWESSRNDEGAVIETCCLITTEARDDLQRILHRMPVMLPCERLDAWLDPGATSEQLEALLALVPQFPLEQRRANPFVNSSKHEGPRCLEPPDLIQRSLFDAV